MNFSKKLLSWYLVNKRDFPWRRTKDPYLIWLSEIILQQTRIEQGRPYYDKFVTAFPAIKDLAAADEQSILKLWQGLGYYSRARNLHSTAQTIMNGYGGEFPRTHAELRKLKGIGDYTASAIASICFDQPEAVMDGNVIRFISRLFGITGSTGGPETKRKIHAIATEKLDRQNPGDFNQAMMEFGATVCTPASPGCMNCIFKKQCFAFNNNLVDELPERDPKAVKHDRFIHYLVVTVSADGQHFIYLNKRSGKDIWKNLYDFPSVEHSPDKKRHLLPEQEFATMLNCTAKELRDVSGEYIHVLTHQKLHVRFYWFHSDQMRELPYLLIPLTEIHKYPVPKLIERYLAANIMVPD